jgi:hypothetical protein
MEARNRGMELSYRPATGLRKKEDKGAKNWKSTGTSFENEEKE